MFVTLAFRIQTICVFLVCFLLHVVGFCTDFWYAQSGTGGYSKYHGLWKQCDTFSGKPKCTSLVGHDSKNIETGKLRWCQALMSLAVITNLVAGGLFIAWLSCGRRRLSPNNFLTLPKIGHGFCLISGALTVIAVAIFGSYYAEHKQVVSWSYVLVCIGTGLMCVTSIICLPMLIHCVTDKPPSEKRPDVESSKNLLKLPPLPAPNDTNRSSDRPRQADRPSIVRPKSMEMMDMAGPPAYRPQPAPRPAPRPAPGSRPPPGRNKPEVRRMLDDPRI